MFGQDLSDANLLRRVRRGDLRAYVALLKRHDAMLRGLATRMLADPDQVDPVLHRAYGKAWRAAGMARIGSGGDAVASWLYRMVYNACVDELRRQAPHPGPALPTGPRVRLPKAPAERRLSALRALPSSERIPLVLVDGEGFTVPAAARILQRQPSDVQAALERARRHWRDLVIGPPAPREPGASESADEEETAAPDGQRAGAATASRATRTAAREVPEDPDSARAGGAPGGAPPDARAPTPVPPAQRQSPDITEPEDVVHAAEGAFDEDRFAKLKRWFRTKGGKAPDPAEPAGPEEAPVTVDLTGVGDRTPSGGAGSGDVRVVVVDDGPEPAPEVSVEPTGSGSGSGDGGASEDGAAAGGDAEGPGTSEDGDPVEPAAGSGEGSGHDVAVEAAPGDDGEAPGDDVASEDAAGEKAADEDDPADGTGGGDDPVDEALVVKVGAETEAEGTESSEESQAP